MSTLPPLAAIRVFEAAGRLEHFSRAAEELGLTQAAVSYQVKQLENHLGEQLFERAGGRVHLTATGRRLHGPISEAFGTMTQAFADLDQQNDQVLSVTAPVSIGSTWLSGAIGRFQLLYPDLALRFSVTNTLIDFSGGQTDIGIRGGHGDYPGLRAQFLFRLYITPICSPEFARENNLSEPADLRRVNRINPDDALWRLYFQSLGLTPPPLVGKGLVMENQAQEVGAAREGFGVALLTPLFWREELAAGRLVQPIDHVLITRVGHWLVHSARRVGVRKIERFREWLVDELARPENGIPAAAFEPLGKEAQSFRSLWDHDGLPKRPAA